MDALTSAEQYPAQHDRQSRLRVALTYRTYRAHADVHDPFWMSKDPPRLRCVEGWEVVLRRVPQAVQVRHVLASRGRRTDGVALLRRYSGSEPWIRASGGCVVWWEPSSEALTGGGGLRRES